MMLILGILLIPLSIYIVLKERDYKTTDKERNILDIKLFLISVLFIVVTFIINKEPFVFDIETGRDYLLYTLLLFIFTPFLWINLGHFVYKLTKRKRIKKNAKVKNKSEYIYYRDILDKLSPGLLMYIRSFEVDTKKAISSTILKLKLNKNIKEEKNKFTIVNKNGLNESEKMVLSLLDGYAFDEKKYKETLREEALNAGFIKNNNFGIFIKIIKLIFLIIIPVFNTILSIKFDTYVYDNYKVYVYDHKRYVLVGDKIGDIHFDHPKNYNDYYNGYVKELGSNFYDKSLIRANLYSNKKVKKTVIMQTVDALYASLSIILDIIFIYLVIEELVYIKRKFKRTKKGVEIINKSYALKNFLRDFSDLKNKNEKDLILWEYYLVYSVALGINEKIDDELINKYIN